MNINSSFHRQDDFDKDREAKRRDNLKEEDEQSNKGKGNESNRGSVSNRGENSRSNRSPRADIRANNQADARPGNRIGNASNRSINHASNNQHAAVNRGNSASSNKHITVEQANDDLDMDVLEAAPRGQATSSRSSVREAKQPSLTESNPGQKDIQETVKEAQKEHKIPKTDDLFKLLPKETRELLDSIFSSGFGAKINPRNFFDMLSKMIPLSIALVQGNGKGEGTANGDISQTLASMVNEMEAILQKHTDSTSLSQENKNLLENLANQLKTISQDGQSQSMAKQLETLLSTTGNPVDVTKQQGLIKKLIDGQLLPSTMMNNSSIPKEVLQSALLQLQQSGSAFSSNQSQGMVQTLVQMSQLFSTVQAFPPEQREQVIKMMMRTQTLFTSNLSQGLLGTNTQQMTKDISTMLLNLSQGIGAIPSNETIRAAGTQYLSRVLGELILAGAILGRLVIDKGDGRAMEIRDALQVGQAQMRATRELGIIDLVPFSFLAFFAPLEQLGGGKSQAEKEAIDALMKFIRTLMSLLFMLVAIYTGGKKIGEDGINLMLEENHDYLSQNIENLIFCLKKLGEQYGVDVKSSVQKCARAKVALNAHRFDEFWDHIFSFLTQKNDLFAFLEEVDQLDPLYESIHSLLKESGFEHISIMRM